MRLFRCSIGIVFLFVATVFAQSYETGSVVKWETKPFEQTHVHYAGNRVVYSIKVGDVTYQIARYSNKVDMTKGDQIQCRVEKDHMIVRNGKGKEIKYDIVGTE